MSDPKPQAQKLGELMCMVTTQILWQPAADWVQQRASGSSLVCRVGSGQATYHRFDPQRKLHQITYGLRMIQAKHQPVTASGWLSTREIQKRGYFSGELSTLNLLAHTCCHEFAHLLQHSAGKRYRGSVHNRHFYNILDELHESGLAEATREALATRASEHQVPLSNAQFQLPDPALQPSPWQVDDPVMFVSGTQEFQGEIIRVNRKTCTVKGTGKFQGQRYRVPLSMLQRTH
ncbi:hypothetical protein [Marinobacter sp. F3R11]|uniref:hypothetical protein n=1 Tax=Marinobacter sp. F3R11 TaxID=2267231 RepID=UPI000DE861CF|nr:hypothetical protein [Marinobacter sp. F3R11]RBW51962.1 hypothetical protein DS878_01085 [Marinobacter sp. F3R11]